MGSIFRDAGNTRHFLTAFLLFLTAASVAFAGESVRGNASLQRVKNPGESPGIRITVDKTNIGMGRAVTVVVRAAFPDGKPAAGYLALTYVNGRRWGAHEYTDQRGGATVRFPLPNPGIAEIQAVIRENTRDQNTLAHLYTGRRIPPDARVSNKVRVDVAWREPRATVHDPEHLVGIQWEPWFTPQAAFWQTAAAVPLVGFYDSYNRDVIRQHVLWFADLGVDFILADWSNHIWDKKHWSERSPETNTILHATTLLLETLADMKTEGIPVPKVVIMPGLSNGPPAAMTALNEQLDWIYQTYLRNPRFNGLFQEYDGKPLVVILDTGALANPEGTAESAYRIPFIRQTIGLEAEELDKLRVEMRETPVDDSHFTVRWMSTQHQITGHDKLGYWSWMDGAVPPVLTYRGGKAEAVTVTPSFFAARGWKGPGAYGRRGGATYVETFRTALEARPRVLMLHQFNEFAGQREGEGMGPGRDIYVDAYNVELSDDLEPVSLTAPAYRGTGGWGYYYLNLTRALLDLYRQKTPETTVVAVARPGRGETVSSDFVEVEWSWAGKDPDRFSVFLNGVLVARNIRETKARLDLKAFRDGPVRLVVRAEGTRSRYVLSHAGESLPLEKDVPAIGEIDFILKRGK